jgi:hypothetical protein
MRRSQHSLARQNQNESRGRFLEEVASNARRKWQKCPLHRKTLPVETSAPAPKQHGAASLLSPSLGSASTSARVSFTRRQLLVRREPIQVARVARRPVGPRPRRTLPPPRRSHPPRGHWPRNGRPQGDGARRSTWAWAAAGALTSSSHASRKPPAKSGPDAAEGERATAARRAARRLAPRPLERPRFSRPGVVQDAGGLGRDNRLRA